MTFPTLKPTARTFEPGDWPVKTYNSMSGREIRIRYGDKRYNAKLKLEYKNIADSSANEFLTHYNTQYGTYEAFTLNNDVVSGWSGSSYIPDEAAMKFRYTKAPTVVSVRPGVSTVSVELTGVI